MTNPRKIGINYSLITALYYNGFLQCSSDNLGVDALCKLKWNRLFCNYSNKIACLCAFRKKQIFLQKIKIACLGASICTAKCTDRRYEKRKHCDFFRLPGDRFKSNSIEPNYIRHQNNSISTRWQKNPERNLSSNGNNRTKLNNGNF